MIEYLDIRLWNKWTIEQFGDSLGVPLYPGGATRWNKLDEAAKKLLQPMTRKVIIRTDDPMFSELKRRILRDEAKSGNGSVAGGILIHRKYARSELENSDLIQIKIHLGFKHAGEEKGTVYDDREACSTCGRGRVQVSPLRLDLSKGPKDLDIARTVVNEYVVSKRLADAMRAESISGVDLAPVEHVGRRKADRAWYQLRVTANAGRTCPPTRFGDDYIRDSCDEKHTCQRHGLVGLNLLSEVSITETPSEDADVMITADRYGIWGAMLMPTPIFIVTQRFFRLLQAHGVKGFSAEVVHMLGQKATQAVP